MGCETVMKSRFKPLVEGETVAAVAEAVWAAEASSSAAFRFVPALGGILDEMRLKELQDVCLKGEKQKTRRRQSFQKPLGAVTGRDLRA